MENKKQDPGLKHIDGATNIDPPSFKKEESNQGTTESQTSIPENWAASYYGLHNVDKTKWIEIKPLKKIEKEE